MKLSDLLTIVPAMQALTQIKLPAKVSYRVGKAMNMIEPELRAYEKTRGELMRQYGKPHADGMKFTFEGENRDEFVKAMDALVAEEVTTKLPTVTLEDLGDIEIEPAHLAALDGIILVEVAPAATGTPA